MNETEKIIDTITKIDLLESKVKEMQILALDLQKILSTKAYSLKVKKERLNNKLKFLTLNNK